MMTSRKSRRLRGCFRPFGFEIETFIDEPKLYILVASKCRFRDAVDDVE